MRYAVLDKNVVEDIVLWDGNEGDGKPFSETLWPGKKLVQLDDDIFVTAGYVLTNGEFGPPKKAKK